MNTAKLIFFKCYGDKACDQFYKGLWQQLILDPELSKFLYFETYIYGNIPNMGIRHLESQYSFVTKTLPWFALEFPDNIIINMGMGPDNKTLQSMKNMIHYAYKKKYSYN